MRVQDPSHPEGAHLLPESDLTAWAVTRPSVSLEAAGAHVLLFFITSELLMFASQRLWLFFFINICVKNLGNWFAFPKLSSSLLFMDLTCSVTSGE